MGINIGIQNEVTQFMTVPQQSITLPIAESFVVLHYLKIAEYLSDVLWDGDVYFLNTLRRLLHLTQFKDCIMKPSFDHFGSDLI